jgi:hypothetical protein
MTVSAVASRYTVTIRTVTDAWKTKTEIVATRRSRGIVIIGTIITATGRHVKSTSVNARCTTRAGVFTRAPTTSHPRRMRGVIVSTGMPKNRSQWQKTIKRKVRANDLDALRLLLVIKGMDKWNRDLAKEHHDRSGSDS